MWESFPRQGLFAMSTRRYADRVQRPFCLALMLCIPCAPVVQANDEALARWLHGELRAATGIDYSRGDYGHETETEMLYVPFTLTYLFDQFAPSPTPRDQLELKLSVPYLEVDGPIEAGAEVVRVLTWSSSHETTEPTNPGCWLGRHHLPCDEHDGPTPF